MILDLNKFPKENGVIIVPADFGFDVEQEKIIIQKVYDDLFKNYLYPKYAHFGFSAETVDFENNKNLQFAGVDILAEMNGKPIKIDVKAQTNTYINNPTPTFCLELDSYSKGHRRIGWYLNEDIQTTHYLFIWINDADVLDFKYKRAGENIIRKGRAVLRPEDIKDYTVALVSKKKAEEYFAGKGVTKDLCEQIVNYFRSPKGLAEVEHYDTMFTSRGDRPSGNYGIFYNHKTNSFCHDKKTLAGTSYTKFTLTKSDTKNEAPINMIVMQSTWFSLASGVFYITNGLVEDKKKTSNRKSA